MAALPDDLIDTYLSDQWRICGGPQSRQVREELRDRLIPITLRAFGSVDASLDILLKESPFSNGSGIPELLRAYELYWLKRNREAVEAGDRGREQICSSFQSQFHQLYCFECEKLGVSTSDRGDLHAILRTDYCRLPTPVIEYAPTNPFRGDGDAQRSRPGPKALVDAGRRKAKKRSYEKFAAHIGIGKDTLYAITNETRWLSDETYILMAEACGCKPEDLHPRDIPRPERRRG